MTGNPTLGGHTSQFWFEPGEWYHVAATWRLSPGEAHGEHMTALFVNGEPVEQESRHRLTGAPRELPSGEFPLAETNERIQIGPLDGTLAQLRISDTVRYRAPFDPPGRVAQADEHTLALFPLDGGFDGFSRSGGTLALRDMK